jgi:ribosomal protein L16/L10AE
MFEVGGGLTEEAAKEALNHAAYKLPIRTKVVARHGMIAGGEE